MTDYRLWLALMAPNRNISELIDIMKKLLSPQGCPWDREQTHQSLAPYAIEEASELADALDRGDLENMKEELGDLLFQVIFHSALGEQTKTFTLSDVIGGICDKLVRRHPHVFSDVKVSGTKEVLENWQKLKDKEKKTPKGPLDVPPQLPALQRAQKIGQKTKDLKFDWDNGTQVFEKVKEEMRELTEALQEADKAHIEEELGDMFFVLAQLARHLKLDAETAARKSNQKFIARFEHMIQDCERKGVDFVSLPVEEKEQLWNNSKKYFKK